MSVSGIQGQLLEVTVVACNKLRDTEWISRQDPYVCVEYASSKFRTRTCTDGGKNPTFQEKFAFTMIEGLREMNVVVWNSNTITTDDFIGSGMVQLQKVLTQGYDDSSWSLQSKTGRYAGEVRLILHYGNANKPARTYAPSAPPYGIPQAPLYSTPPPPPAHVSASPYPQPAPYPAPSPSPSPYSYYQPSTGGYPPSMYPPPQPSAYPPPPYPPTSSYPPTSTYPPSPYPPPPQASPYYPAPPGPYPGVYPPRPY
ncbi:hypothetical protein UlMin_032191 [Ulmus minor]